MNTCSSPALHDPRLARRGHLLSLVVLALGLGGDVYAAGPSPLPAATLMSKEPDPGRLDARPVDICIEREPLDPADDFWWEPPFERPDGPDDYATDAVQGELWLTAASPNQLGAYITGDRVWHWDGNPADPIWQFRVDPSRPIEHNAKLELHLRAQPGYDYDVYFWFGPSPEMHGSSVRISNDALDTKPTMQPVGSGWTAVSGPELDEEPVNHIIALDLHGSPAEEARWSVTAVHIIATPE